MTTYIKNEQSNNLESQRATFHLHSKSKLMARAYPQDVIWIIMCII